MGSLNVGNIDRFLRVVLGSALVACAAAGVIGIWGYLGIVPILTGLAARCPLYSIFGISTTKR